MTENQLAFIEANKENFDTARLGYVRNLDKETLQGYETIYREALNKDFVLTYWCSGCVLNMMKDLIKLYDAHFGTLPESTEVINTKRKSKKNKDASNKMS